MSRAEGFTPTQGASHDDDTVVPENVEDTVVPNNNDTVVPEDIDETVVPNNNDSAVSDNDNDTVVPDAPATRRTTPGDGATSTAGSKDPVNYEEFIEVNEHGQTVYKYVIDF
ncbi:hypothetical protein B9479_004330 [Cryptococcus floricola]|uniref:Uncharacterized protein n=1 Tax=Cryptococcus floricola TaxID=2591691 RepID=A0A5D3AXI3_9TREE|nr:hypothetical protein B9479_004330 [Cryptococcus floricola]